MNFIKTKLTIILTIIMIFVTLFISWWLKEINLEGLYFNSLAPIIWLSIASFIYLKEEIKLSEPWKYKKETRDWLLITALVYVIFYFTLGFITGFSKNPYDNSYDGIKLNIWTIGVVLITKEYIRGSLLKISKKKNIIKMGIVISLLYTLSELNLNNISSNFEDTIVFFKFFTSDLMPIIVENGYLTYIAIIGGFIPTIIYKLIISSFFWISPVLPNPPWTVIAFFNFLLPCFSFLFIYQTIKRKEKIITKRKLEELSPKQLLPNFFLIALVIVSSLGLLPIRGVAILTGSMYPNIKVGDVVIVKKWGLNNIKVNDIIEYKKDKYSVVHRVVKMNTNNELITYITKGDNNNVVDNEPITKKDIIGKVIIVIPKIGYPTVWLHNLINDKQEPINIETGNNKRGQ